MSDELAWKLLVVEDSETQAIKLVGLLEEAGIGAAHAASAKDALDALRDNQFDLVLVDYHLPDMQGDDLCRQIRLSPGTADVLLLMLTGDSQAEVERLGLDSGADDYMPKSADDDALLARINALLRTRNRSSAAAFRPGTGQGRRQLVFVVDDSMTFLEFLRQELIADGYEVETFGSGDLAIERLTHGACDCFLVDLVMPGIDGMEMCRRLDRFRNTGAAWFPLLMITGHDTKEDMMRALEAGADDFVSKSSDISILKARIRSLLRRKLQRDEHERISGHFRAQELEIVRERTEREAAERRAALADQLEVANQELKNTQAQLIQAAKMASLGELVAGIAHEINNPVAYVKGHADTVARLLDQIMADADVHMPPPAMARIEKARNRTGDIADGLERVRQLVLKLRTFSRLDEGEFKKCDMRENIEAVIAILHHRLQDGITLSTDFCDDNSISCYPAPLNQVVMNLVSNAMDAVDGHGDVAIETRREAGNFKILVADNGPGIDKAIADRIYEPFFTTKPVGVGVGLGLSISYRIIQSHRGSIEVCNRPEGGALFTVSIPLDLEDRPHERTPL
ncbi:response regulator [Ferrovibrio xuzhouensis]|uniref:histidine kinase n=1 Tax=Ferrovibrio xuzhouensis TaxID=1576914 RepID=A0ABV7VD24_9PROT